MYEVNTIGFQTFFVWAFKIGVDYWKVSMLLLYILWDDSPIFMISRSNEQLQQESEYTLLKPDCHSWSISKIQSDTLEERYTIKFCFKHGKNATETYGMLQTAFRPSCINWALVFEWHKRFKEGRALLLIVHTWNSSLLWSFLLRLQCTRCTVPWKSSCVSVSMTFDTDSFISSIVS